MTPLWLYLSSNMFDLCVFGKMLPASDVFTVPEASQTPALFCAQPPQSPVTTQPEPPPATVSQHTQKPAGKRPRYQPSDSITTVYTVANDVVEHTPPPFEAQFRQRAVATPIYERPVVHFSYPEFNYETTMLMGRFQQVVYDMVSAAARVSCDKMATVLPGTPYGYILSLDVSVDSGTKEFTVVAKLAMQTNADGGTKQVLFASMCAPLLKRLCNKLQRELSDYALTVCV